MDGLVVVRRTALYTLGTRAESAGATFTALSPAGTGKESAEALPRRMKLRMERERTVGISRDEEDLDRGEGY
jgi:hypothetical protein